MNCSRPSRWLPWLHRSPLRGKVWRFFLPSELFDSMGIQWLHLPTPDYFSPTIADIQLGTDFSKSKQGLCIR